MAPERKSAPGQRAYLPVALRRALRQTHEYRCTYVDPATGRRCESRRDLQIEHVTPLAQGGTNAPENLTLLCGTHNRYRAEVALGTWVRKYARN